MENFTITNIVALGVRNKTASSAYFWKFYWPSYEFRRRTIIFPEIGFFLKWPKMLKYDTRTGIFHESSTFGYITSYINVFVQTKAFIKYFSKWRPNQNGGSHRRHLFTETMDVYNWWDFVKNWLFGEIWQYVSGIEETRCYVFVLYFIQGKTRVFNLFTLTWFIKILRFCPSHLCQRF